MTGARSGRGVVARVLRALAALALSLGLALPGGGVPGSGSRESLERHLSPAPGRDGLVLSQVIGVREHDRTDALRLASADRRRTALWGWPLAGVPPVIKTFDPPAQRWLPGHRGIDLAGVAGEAVLAVEAGVVSYSGTIAGVGVISVTHESGLRSTYQPVVDPLGRGDRVGRGQRIAVLDTTGTHCVLHDCLHLGAVRGRDDYVDPLPLLLGAELTLLPIEG